MLFASQKVCLSKGHSLCLGSILRKSAKCAFSKVTFGDLGQLGAKHLIAGLGPAQGLGYLKVV